MSEKSKGRSLPLAPAKEAFTPVAGRNCGSCTACCTYFSIPALKKPVLVPCSRLKDKLCSDGKNCSDYDNRPMPSCSYTCMWLYGYGADEDRPDLSGILVDNAIPVENALRAIPLSLGAQDTPRARLAVERISRGRNQPILVCSYPETQLVRFVGRGVE